MSFKVLSDLAFGIGSWVSDFYTVMRLVHQVINTNILLPEARDFWGSRSWRIAKLGLNKNFLHIFSSLVKDVVDKIHFFHQDAVAQHLIWIGLAFLNHFKELFPIEVHWRLAVAHEFNAAFHKRADIKVVGL